MKHKKNITKHDIIRGLKYLQGMVEGLRHQLSVLENTFVYYLDMKGDKEELKNILEKEAQTQADLETEDEDEHKQ